MLNVKLQCSVAITNLVIKFQPSLIFKTISSQTWMDDRTGGMDDISQHLVLF